MYLAPLLPDKVYHIYNHANGNENLFRTKENYRYFLEKYAAYILPIAETYAYCLMPNHFHLMVRVRSEEVLLAFFKDKLLRSSLQGFDQGEALRQLVSAQFSHLFNAYSKAYNKLYGRMGSLFVPRFKRKSVDSDSYFAQLIAYIHLNPVRHGFCDHVLDWEHSSIHTYYGDKATRINRRYLMDGFGDKKELLDFHRAVEIDEGLFGFD